jgi:transitional endoplasmic reticulum ATPase
MGGALLSAQARRKGTEVTVDRVAGLRSAVAADPGNPLLRLLLAEALMQTGDPLAALAEYEHLLAAEQLDEDGFLAAGRAALAAGRHDRAQAFVEAAAAAGMVDGVSQLKNEINDSLGLQGVLQVGRSGIDEDGVAQPPRLELDSKATVGFADVGGLDEVKKAIHRTIILPFQRHDLYEKYNRGAGGGVLLFGPPGCGKTLLARATAGECGLPFSNVRIEEILDPFFGVSERNLHDAFVQARRFAPCVLFLDELDAVAFARRKHSGSVGRPLVDQLLQELDSIGSDNEGVLVLAATNAPWDVDEAMKRPGRFDRVVFVPPPDPPARERILSLQLAGRPADDVDVKQLANKTPLFSGADLRALVERAVDIVIDDALDSGEERALTTADLEQALAGMRPSTLEWLATARNYVEFANQGGRYDEVASFLVSREARAWKDN